VLALLVRAEIAHDANPEARQQLVVAIGKVRHRAGTIETAPLHTPAIAREIAAEIAKIASTFQRQQALRRRQSPAAGRRQHDERSPCGIRRAQLMATVAIILRDHAAIDGHVDRRIRRHRAPANDRPAVRAALDARIFDHRRTRTCERWRDRESDHRETYRHQNSHHDLLHSR